MRTLIAIFFLLCNILVYADSITMRDGVKAWSDREYLISDLDGIFQPQKSVPVQKCTGFTIIIPRGTTKALIALYSSKGAADMAKNHGLKPLNKSIYIGREEQRKMSKYDLFIVDNPPEKIDCMPTKAGGLLLAVNDDVPDRKATNASEIPLTELLPEKLTGVQSFEGQEYRFQPGKRMVKYYVRTPRKGIDTNTGLMLLSHNWGGTWEYTAPWCDLFSDRYNLICLSVNYLQSGETKHDKVPYDHGVLQAMDCLRALYEVINVLDANNIKFKRNRIYAAGASGGGNVSLMVNKLAPNTFGCIIDLCGMPGLTDEIAFGKGSLNAGYSAYPQSPKYLTAAMREIRDPGNMIHLSLQKKYQVDNKVVIVHGLDDASCNPADKMVIAANMVRAGFRPDTHFLTANDVDGVIVCSTNHNIGNRPEVISKFAHPYIAENGKFAALVKKSDFDVKSEIIYPVTGGKYIISFKETPTLTFSKEK